MNLKYLGDALDHWKGSVFEKLQDVGLLQRFAVDAMASDADSWKPADWSLFSSLLRVKSAQIIRHNASLDGDRHAYFGEVVSTGDLFLDPDIGIQTGTVKDKRQYLKPSELFQVLETDRGRLVVVYQHVRAQRTRDRVEQVLVTLRAVRGTFSCTSYESSTVAMLFFSLTRSRIKSVGDYFEQFLGSHAARRIGLWL